jgi:hypothetical protein
MTDVKVVLTDIEEEVVDDTGQMRSARTRKFYELDSKARHEIEVVLGRGETKTKKIGKQSGSHSFGGHDVLQTVVNTAYVAGIAKIGHSLLNGLKAWAALNKGREVKIAYEAKSGKHKEIKITGYSAKSAEQIFKAITADIK